jgi:hypothetical protein
VALAVRRIGDGLGEYTGQLAAIGARVHLHRAADGAGNAGQKFAAAEVAVGLAIIVALFRRRQTIQVEELNALTAAHFEETQLYRIDHYLGKEIILNISTLRWANALFEPMWTAKHVESVQIVFKENIGTEGRGGYFDEFGIIRDLLQNHLLQAFMFLAMEPPEAMTAAAILAAKVELLRTVRTLDLHEGKRVFLGQFTKRSRGLNDSTLHPIVRVFPTGTVVKLVK